MTGRLQGKVAVVTGAGSGIGKAMAEAFVREGAKVIAADITGVEARTAQELGDAAFAFRADVSIAADVRAMMDAALTRFGQLDILCNNAGLDGAMASLADYDDAEFDRVVAVNLRGVFLGMKHAIPLLEERGGAIVNVASIAGSVVMPKLGPYCAAKAGVMQLTKVAAAEYGARNIRANAICPGVIRTGMVAQLPAEFIEGLKATTPASRIAEPLEVANLAVFLASDEAPFVTGCSINIDGGYTLL